VALTGLKKSAKISPAKFKKEKKKERKKEGRI